MGVKRELDFKKVKEIMESLVFYNDRILKVRDDYVYIKTGNKSITKELIDVVDSEGIKFTISLKAAEDNIKRGTYFPSKTEIVWYEKVKEIENYVFKNNKTIKVINPNTYIKAMGNINVIDNDGYKYSQIFGNIKRRLAEGNFFNRTKKNPFEKENVKLFCEINYPEVEFIKFENKIATTKCKCGKINNSKIAEFNQSYQCARCSGREIVTRDRVVESFFKVINEIGYIPLSVDFYKRSDMSETGNRKFFPIYSDMVKELCTEIQYLEYEEYRKRRRSKIGFDSRIDAKRKYTDEFLEENLKKIFNKFILENNSMPSRHTFNFLSAVCSSMYRHRFNESWTETCKRFGYEIDRTFKSEKECVNLLSEILSCKPHRQKSWDWLIGHGKGNMFCDAYFKEYNLVLEFNGIQHRKPIDRFGGEKAFKRNIENDVLKIKLLKEHGIQTMVVWFDEDWRNKDFLIAKLRELNIII